MANVRRPTNDNISISQIANRKDMPTDAREKLQDVRETINHMQPDVTLSVTVIKRDGMPVTFTANTRNEVELKIYQLVREWKVYLSKIGEVEVGHHSESMIESYRQLTYGAEPMQVFVAHSFRNAPLNNYVVSATVGSYLSGMTHAEDSHWRVLPKMV